MLTRSKRQRNKEQSAAVDAASDASIRTHLDQSPSPSREPCTKSMRTDHFQSSGSTNPSASVDSDAPIPIDAQVLPLPIRPLQIRPLQLTVMTLFLQLPLLLQVHPFQLTVMTLFL